MPGAPDPLYVAARQVLLDALDALRNQLGALVLVGAQAVYVHAGEADLEVAPFTTDSDLAIDPRKLESQPLLEEALAAARFKRADNTVGVWEMSLLVDGISRMVTVDLLVPESLGGPGRRGARIPPHATNAARKVTGLESALIDREMLPITALDPDDSRKYDLAVAGPAALIVAKVHKILDREDTPDRVTDKDALDIYRLLRAVPTNVLITRFSMLVDDELSREVARRTIREFPRFLQDDCRLERRWPSEPLGMWLRIKLSWRRS